MIAAVILRDRRRASFNRHGIKVPPIKATLFQRSADRSEARLELGAYALDGADDRKRNTGSNKTVLDGGRTGLVFEKSANCFHAAVIDPASEGLVNQTV